jgi:hypothetical protein
MPRVFWKMTLVVVITSLTTQLVLAQQDIVVTVKSNRISIPTL